MSSPAILIGKGITDNDRRRNPVEDIRKNVGRFRIRTVRNLVELNGELIGKRATNKLPTKINESAAYIVNISISDPNINFFEGHALIFETRKNGAREIDDSLPQTWQKPGDWRIPVNGLICLRDCLHIHGFNRDDPQQAYELLKYHLRTQSITEYGWTPAGRERGSIVGLRFVKLTKKTKKRVADVVAQLN